MAASKAWLWPDRLISSTESGELREEHNRVVNREQRLEDLLRHALVYVEDQLDDPRNKRGVVKAMAKQIRDELAKEGS